MDQTDDSTNVGEDSKSEISGINLMTRIGQSGPQRIEADTIKKLQKEDFFCGPRIEYLINDILPKDNKSKMEILASIEQYRIDEGSNLLFRTYVPHKNRGKFAFHQLCVPSVLREEILFHIHNNPLGGGHYGVEKSFYKMSVDYFFPKMYDYTKKYV